ncbi:EamA family transporter [Poritiphilus flavus]|uniref:EamA family transporter n=1 Tax=Poritiphilus flavus TaxID=2697053 RepID=A0A6L9EF57_9FLAO|nr:EamA family transporter [Poritiphilus flavus]NAS13366.1 EamA family transporter [Poritiphilus flavus]
MLPLVLSILSSSLIFVIFKLYAVHKVQTFYAIIMNYMVACTVGLIFFENPVPVGQIINKPWIPGAAALGVLFIFVFNIMAITSQKLGVSVASVATKMSLAIPVIFGVFLYNEKLGILKILGIVLALVAVYYASVKENSFKLDKRVLFLPVLVFLSSGLIDTSLKFMEDRKVPPEEFPLFSAMVFGCAACAGLVIILFKSFKTPLSFNSRNLLGGIALGVPNFFSIFFLLKALQHETLNSASIFTINNVAIVMLSTILGILLFKEEVSTKNWMGVALAVVSIILVALF